MAHPEQEDSTVRKEIGSQMEGESFKWMPRYGPLGTCHWDSYLKVAKGESYSHARNIKCKDPEVGMFSRCWRNSTMPKQK